ncbi:alcohol dehydrogenase catalytic domain-containing protein [Streptomyces sp. L7]
MDSSPTPSRAPGEILIRVAYAGVNYGEIQHRLGDFGEPDGETVTGLEASGRVAALGEGVTGVVGRRRGDGVPPGRQATRSTRWLRRRSRSLLPGTSAFPLPGALALPLPGTPALPLPDGLDGRADHSAGRTGDSDRHGAASPRAPTASTGCRTASVGVSATPIGGRAASLRVPAAPVCSRTALTTGRSASICVPPAPQRSSWDDGLRRTGAAPPASPPATPSSSTRRRAGSAARRRSSPGRWGPARSTAPSARRRRRSTPAVRSATTEVFVREGFPEAVLAATSGRGVDIVLDPVGGPTRLASFEVLALSAASRSTAKRPATPTSSSPSSRSGRTTAPSPATTSATSPAAPRRRCAPTRSPHWHWPPPVPYGSMSRRSTGSRTRRRRTGCWGGAEPGKVVLAVGDPA